MDTKKEGQKNLSTFLIVIILVGAFFVLRSALMGTLGGTIQDSDFADDALSAQAGCTAPSLSSIAVSNITSSSATVTWASSQQATSAVRLGLTSGTMVWLATTDTPASTSGVMTHSYNLAGLQANRTYYYRVRSSNGTCQKTSSTYTFQTLAVVIPPPVDVTAPTPATNLSASNVSQTSLTLSWTASTDASGIHAYDIYRNGTYIGSTPNGTTTTFNVTGLTASTSYGFIVQPYDNASPSNYTIPGSATLSVTTLATAGDTTAPTAPTNLTSPSKTSSSVSLSWNASSDNVGVTGYNVYIGTNIQNGALITGTTYTVTGLSASTPYVFTVKARDAAGNWSSASNSLTITTSAAPDTTAPTISGVTATGVTTNAATISWSTNESANGTVDYGTTTSYGLSSTNSVLSTGHSATLSGLTANTLYHYRVKSADAAGNLATSGDYTFTTQPTQVACPTTGTDPYGSKGMWSWKDTPTIITTGSTAQVALWSYISAKKINMIYLNMPTSYLQNTTYAANLKTFMNTAWNTYCARVQLLSGDNTWQFFPGNPYNPAGAPTTNAIIDWVNAGKAFDASITGTNVHPYGFNIDVEPYTNPYWETHKTQTAQALIYMYDYIEHQMLQTSNLQSVAVAPRWFDNSAGLTAITYNGVTKNLMQHVFDNADEFGIMDYVVSGSSIYNDAANELSYAITLGKKAILGVETISLASGNGTTSFWGTSCTTLNNALSTAYNSVVSNNKTAGFGGFAVHSYYDSNSTGYRHLCP